MNMKTSPTTEVHQAAMVDFKAVLKKYDSLSAMELLAIASQLVGNLVALQDQTRVTPEMAMQLVADNIQAGNQEAINGLLGDVQGNG